MCVNNYELTITGKFIKTARIKNEYTEYVEDLESIVKDFKATKVNADIFSFWQKLPEIKPKYAYPMKWDYLAVIPVKSYDNWFENQINSGSRKAIRKAKKIGVEIKIADYDDELIQGIVNIYNETPIRQGRPYPHYGKDFETVKQEGAKDIDLCNFIGAYYENELIGFIKLYMTKSFVIPFGMVSKIRHRDKSPQNAILAKAVEICDKKSIPYLLYGSWDEGTLNDFKIHNGCEKINIPRYFVPLSVKGNVALKLNMHHSLKDMLPQKLKLRLVDLRKKWYSS